MIQQSIKFGSFWMLVAASVAAPLAIRHFTRMDLLAKSRLLHEQIERVAQLQAENHRLSNAAAAAQSLLSAAQLKEILNLRSEAGRLRAESNEIQSLLEENQRLQAQPPTNQNHPAPLSPAESEQELSTETLEAMKNLIRVLPNAVQRYAAEHPGEKLDDFGSLRNYFPVMDGHKMTGLYTFEFVRDEGPVAGDAVVLRESSARQLSDGGWARVYGFSNGTVTEVNSDKDDFESWEKGYITPPSASGK